MPTPRPHPPKTEETEHSDRLVAWAQLALFGYWLVRMVVFYFWPSLATPRPDLRFRLAMECSLLIWLLLLRRILSWVRYQPALAPRWPRLVGFHLPRILGLSLLTFAAKTVLLRAVGIETGTALVPTAVLAVLPIQLTIDALAYLVLAAASSAYFKRRQIDHEETAARQLKADLAEAQWQQSQATISSADLEQALARLAELARHEPDRAERELPQLGDLLRRLLEDDLATSGDKERVALELKLFISSLASTPSEINRLGGHT